MERCAPTTETIQEFNRNIVLQSESVTKKWLANFQSISTRKSYVWNIINFFRWLWIVKQIYMTPDQVLADHNDRLLSKDIPTRVYWSYLTMEFAKDSAMPEGGDGWQGNKPLSHTAKSQARYAVYSWFAYNDLPLQAVKAIRIEETEREDLPPITLKGFTKVVKRAPLKWSSALLVDLHSAVRIGDLFDQVGLLWSVIKDQIDKKTCIIKINARGMEILHEIPWSEIGTKLVCLKLYGATTRGKTFHYITFLGRDAIDELSRYVKERGEPAKGERLWDCDKTRLQKGITSYAIQEHLMERDKSKKRGGRHYPYHVHRLRKLFKTTCMMRGVGEADGESFCGHKPTGVDKIYDERHLAHPDIFAAEYLKVEPCLNLLSNPEGKTPKATEAFIHRFDPKWKPSSLPSAKAKASAKS